MLTDTRGTICWGTLMAATAATASMNRPMTRVRSSTLWSEVPGCRYRRMSAVSTVVVTSTMVEVVDMAAEMAASIIRQSKPGGR